MVPTLCLRSPQKYVAAADLSRVCEPDIPPSARIGLGHSVRGGIANFLWPAPRGLFKALAVGVISWILATLAVFLLMKRRSLCT
jgi:hypothetical protein